MSILIEKANLKNLLKIQLVLFLVIIVRSTLVIYEFYCSNKLVIYEFYGGNKFDFTSLLPMTFLILPYIFAEGALFLNKKNGMHLLLFVSGIELLFDLVDLVINFHSFGLHFLPDGHGWLNTPFSALTYLYFGIIWNRAFKLKKGDGSVEQDCKRWYKNKQDMLITLLMIIFGGVGYNYVFKINDYLIHHGFGGVWFIELRFVAAVILLECLLINIKHYWNWVCVLIGGMFIIIVLRDAGLHMGRIIFSTISYVVFPPYNWLIICMFGIAIMMFIIKRILGGISLWLK